MAIRTNTDIKQLGSILSVWAHPDDETFSAAGIMAAAAMNGQQVVCIAATRGEAGSYDEQRWPTNKLPGIRTAELEAALAILGIKSHHWLDYKDGHCHEAPISQGASRVAKYIELYQPNSILTFGEDGMTGHLDHIAISRWVTEAVNNLKDAARYHPDVYHAVTLKKTYEAYLKPADEKLNIYFNIDKPPLNSADECDICFELSEALLDKKLKALRAMSSQTEGLFDALNEKHIRHICKCESFICSYS